MLLELIIDKVLTDSDKLTRAQKSVMLGELAREYSELWQSMNSPVSGQVGITNAVQQAYPFNSFEFYRVAYQYGEKCFKRLIRIKAQPHEHEMISYSALYAQEIKEMKAEQKQWTEQDAVDKAIMEISHEIKTRLE